MKYSPHKYQTYATDFILEHPVSAVFLDMGLRKSVITRHLRPLSGQLPGSQGAGHCSAPRGSGHLAL